MSRGDKPGGREVTRLAMSMREAEEASGLSRATLYRLHTSGRLSTLKIGARRFVTVEALGALLKEGGK
jgi:hypothetical protein